MEGTRYVRPEGIAASQDSCRLVDENKIRRKLSGPAVQAELLKLRKSKSLEAELKRPLRRYDLRAERGAIDCRGRKAGISRYCSMDVLRPEGSASGSRYRHPAGMKTPTSGVGHSIWPNGLILQANLQSPFECAAASTRWASNRRNGQNLIRHDWKFNAARTRRADGRSSWIAGTDLRRNFRRHCDCCGSKLAAESKWGR